MSLQLRELATVYCSARGDGKKRGTKFGKRPLEVTRAQPDNRIFALLCVFVIRTSREMHHEVTLRRITLRRSCAGGMQQGELSKGGQRKEGQKKLNRQNQKTVETKNAENKPETTVENKTLRGLDFRFALFSFCV